MMTRTNKTKPQRTARIAWLGVVLLAGPFFCQAAGAMQHGAPAQHQVPRQAPRQAPRPAPNRAPAQRPQSPPQSQARPEQRPARPAGQFAPGYPGNTSARSPYSAPPYAFRPGPPGAGHLPQWMAQHQNLPLPQQEKLLRAEPGFSRLNPTDQQREIQQLHQLNDLPEAQRQRRLARAEALERLSPSERMQVNQAGRQMASLPPDRQSQVRRAFQDLRGVPVDQRETVLNSARYGAAFSPQERGILQNLLRVEPYEAPR